MNKKIFISTGEVSGDLHGSLLSKALLDEAKKKYIDLEICGLGGERMRKEGVKILQDTTSISAIGILVFDLLNFVPIFILGPI